MLSIAAATHLSVSVAFIMGIVCGWILLKPVLDRAQILLGVWFAGMPVIGFLACLIVCNSITYHRTDCRGAGLVTVAGIAFAAPTFGMLAIIIFERT